MVNQSQPVADLLSLEHVVRRNNERHPVVSGVLLEVVPSSVPRHGVEALGGFVEDAHLRVVAYGPHDDDELLLTPRQRDEVPVQAVREPDALSNLLSPLLRNFVWNIS